jgi:hypothetical protein
MLITIYKPKRAWTPMVQVKVDEIPFVRNSTPFPVTVPTANDIILGS